MTSSLPGQIPVTLSAAKTEETILPDRLSTPGILQTLVEEIAAYQRLIPGLPDPAGVETVNFSGLIGDPMTNRHVLVPAMRHLRDNGIRTGMFTNGTLIKPEDMETLVTLSFLHISLDAATGTTYSLLKYGGRPVGQKLFQRALDALRQLGRIRRATNGGVQLAVGFIVYPANYHELYQAAELAKHAGAHVFKIKRDTSCLKLLNAEGRKKVLEQIERARNELEDDSFEILAVHSMNETSVPLREFSKCRITSLMASVGSDGNLYPCNYHPRPGARHYGSVIERGFATAWEGHFRSDLKGMLPTICPPTCDPFKQRANTLFDSLERVRNAAGEEAAGETLDTLFANDPYRSHHITEESSV